MNTVLSNKSGWCLSHQCSTIASYVIIHFRCIWQGAKYNRPGIGWHASRYEFNSIISGLTIYIANWVIKTPKENEWISQGIIFVHIYDVQLFWKLHFLYEHPIPHLLIFILLNLTAFIIFHVVLRVFWCLSIGLNFIAPSLYYNWDGLSSSISAIFCLSTVHPRVRNVSFS